MPIKHGSLYDFSTCPGYGRYFYISDLQGSVRVDKGKIHIERGDEHAIQTDGGDGGA